MIQCAFLNAQWLLSPFTDWTVVQSKSFCKCEARRPWGRPEEEDDPGETSKGGGGISGKNKEWIQAHYPPEKQGLNHLSPPSQMWPVRITWHHNPLVSIALEEHAVSLPSLSVNCSSAGHLCL